MNKRCHLEGWYTEPFKGPALSQFSSEVFKAGTLSRLCISNGATFPLTPGLGLLYQIQFSGSGPPFDCLATKFLTLVYLDAGG